MLYMLADVEAGACALAALLRPDGWLLATTNSDEPKHLLIQLHEQALAALGIAFEPELPGPFTMENGAQALSAAFGNVQRHDFLIHATEQTPEAFARSYQTTGTYNAIMGRGDVADGQKAELGPTFLRLAARLADSDGLLHVPMTMGAFVARRPRF